MPTEKKIAQHSFTDGVNTVLASEALPNTFVRYMLNANILSQGEGNVGVITNLKGNKQIPFDLPTGANTCIGHAVDLENNKFYFFNHNSNNFHGIYQYEKISGLVTLVLLNIDDTGGVDLLNFSLEYPILHAEIIKGRLYWVDGLNSARNFSIARMMDKGPSGYGVVLESYINAYKQTDGYAPIAEYDSDVNYPFNKLYGTLRRFAIRYIYDDGSLSNVSDFSNIPIPSNESFTGVPSIPTANNVINVKFNTGDKTVIKIQVLAQATDYQLPGATLSWVIIANIDKDKTGVSDNSQYVYKFYNDVAPVATDNAKVIRPYSFLPKRPLCMAFVKNAITYANGYMGFGDVDVDATAEVAYTDLFIDNALENEFNDPLFTTVMPPGTGDFVSWNATVFNYNNVPSLWLKEDSPARFNIHEITVGHDVKKGNKFSLRIVTTEGNNFLFEVTASGTDTALSIASKLKQQLTSTGWVYRKTPNLPDTNIFANTIAMNGDVKFRFIFRATKNHNYPYSTAFVNPVQFNTLKDTGQSISNIKMGSITKYGFMYEDIDGGRKSLVYTDNNLIVPIATYNDFGKVMQSTVTLTVNHRPPVWAKRYQVVRSFDFVYNNYIQLLIQKVSAFNDDEAQEYLDLAVGSLYTFQKVHPNSTLQYEFKKGDRLRLMKNVETGVLYEFFETEIIAFNPTVTDRKEENLIANNTNTVAVETTNVSDVDKFIVLDDGTSRKIVDVPDATHYVLDNTIGNTKTYTYYDLVDYRGSVRIRKPEDITITDNSLVEIYTPSSLAQTENIQFFEFQKKFEIIGAGTENRYHAGDTQDQTNSQPAIVKISDGTAYVRNRELPVNNSVPGTQILVSIVEDPSYSDFYSSLINDNGRINVEDTGDGEVHFGSRVWHSGNFIEDTRINGLNDFDNSNREDYNDQYGDIMLTKFDTNLIYTFKQLKTAYIPVDSRITQDSDSLQMNIASGKLLNPIQYIAEEGGIGNNPASYAYNGTHRYYVSVNAGVIIRLGGNGAEPISKTFFLDNEVKRILAEADVNHAKIIGGFDRKNGVYIVSVEGYEKYIYFDGFNTWITENDDLAEDVIFEIVTAPVHGSAIISDNKIAYTPTTDYTGSDTFSYRVQLAGVWQSPKNVCLTIVDFPVNLAWRAIDPYCVLDQYGLQTGYRGWETLEEYDTNSGDAVGDTVPNNPADPRYVAPVYRPLTCVPEPPDPTPDAFSFTPVTDAELNTQYASNIITPTGFNIPIAVSIANGQYRINGGSWVSSAGTLNPGDTVQVRRNSSSAYDTAVNTTLTAGSVNGVFTLTTVQSATINYNQVQQAATYVDINLRIKDNGTTIANPVASGSGSLIVAGGHTISAEIYSSDISPGVNPKDHLIVKENGVEIFNSSGAVPLTPGTIVWTHVALEAAVYDIQSYSDSDAIVNWFVSQSSSPYIDGNLDIKDNTVQIPGSPFLSDGSGTYNITAGHSLSSEALCEEDPVGATNPKLRQVVTRDGGLEQDEQETAADGASIVYGDTAQGGSIYNITVSTFEDAPPLPSCPDRRLVFQICNSNASRDDNFDIYLNGLDPANKIGVVDLSTDAQVGSVFVASLIPLTISDPDFVCPIGSMNIQEFNPALVVGGINTIYMVNTQNNGNDNYGTIGVRNYELTGSDLTNPCIVANLLYTGVSGVNFQLNFDYTACCPGD